MICTAQPASEAAVAPTVGEEEVLTLSPKRAVEIDVPRCWICEPRAIERSQFHRAESSRERRRAQAETLCAVASSPGHDGGVADAFFEDPRLARIYDPLHPDRSDLDVYVDLVEELGARTVLDIGCGTGTFACLLARRGVDVTAVDPAHGSLDVARSKSGAAAVRWLHGDATSLPALDVDAAFMTGNVAQVFLTDDDWALTFRGIRAALGPGGVLVFETRIPARRAWEQWTPELTRTIVDVPGVGVVDSRAEVTDVSGDLVTFRSMTTFRRDDVVLESVSTLRFRERLHIEASLVREGFELSEVRDAPDRPGLEMVFLARRPA